MHGVCILLGLPSQPLEVKLEPFLTPDQALEEDLALAQHMAILMGQEPPVPAAPQALQGLRQQDMARSFSDTPPSSLPEGPGESFWRPGGEARGPTPSRGQQGGPQAWEDSRGRDSAVFQVRDDLKVSSMDAVCYSGTLDPTVLPII